MASRTVRNAMLISVAAAAMATCSSCSSETQAETLPIDLIDEAIVAVDGHFAAESSFYEINVTPDGVNLFVSVAGPQGSPAVVQARYTSARGLVVAEESVEANGGVFAGSAVDFEVETMLNAALEQLSSTSPRVFIITAGPTSESETQVSERVDYRLVMESERGGRLVVLLARDGSILGSDVID